MKTLLRMFKYVRDLEEEVAQSRLTIAKFESGKLENSIPADLDSGLAVHAELGAWIMYQMKKRGITMVGIADICHVSVPSVHTVVWGKRTSARIQKQIATSLGYSSWLELLATRKEAAA